MLLASVGGLGGALRSNEGGDQIVEGGASADFVVGMRRGHSDFSVREKLAGEAFAENQELDGIAHGDFAEMQCNVFFSPRHLEFGFN